MTVNTNNSSNCWKTIWCNNYSHTKDYKAESGENCLSIHNLEITAINILVNILADF